MLAGIDDVLRDVDLVDLRKADDAVFPGLGRIREVDRVGGADLLGEIEPRQLFDLADRDLVPLEVLQAPAASVAHRFGVLRHVEGPHGQFVRRVPVAKVDDLEERGGDRRRRSAAWGDVPVVALVDRTGYLADPVVRVVVQRADPILETEPFILIQHVPLQGRVRIVECIVRRLAGIVLRGAPGRRGPASHVPAVPPVVVVIIVVELEGVADPGIEIPPPSSRDAVQPCLVDVERGVDGTAQPGARHHGVVQIIGEDIVAQAVAAQHIPDQARLKAGERIVDADEVRIITNHREFSSVRLLS